MPFLAKTKTTETNIAPTLFSLLRPSRTSTHESRSPAIMDDVGQKGCVWTHMREELPSGVDSLSLAFHERLRNFVILDLALARLSLGHRREDVHAKVDG
ncbi:hypothetical protein RhiJN_23366 [Ceratobasidium sp. AG-Ba]|nr:hypothetical protein RhiJN_23366 [Ceratobasidium sp. AG-Ba]